MPIYEYQCDKCSYHLEALQKISDKPLRECPDCGKHALRRLISAPRFRLSGSGWYETDFKSDKENKRNLVEKEKGEAPATAAATTSDAGSEKPAAAAKETPAKESSSDERGSSSNKVGSSSGERASSSDDRGSSSSESASKRRTASKPAAVAKPPVKTKPRVAAKPATRKPAVRKR